MDYDVDMRNTLGAIAKQEASAVQSALDALGESQEHLHDIVMKLSSRLDPVLRPLPPAPVGGESSAVQPGPAECSLVLTLRNRANATRCTIADLQDVLARLSL